MKEHIGYGDYLNDVVNIKDRIAMTKPRLSNHKLMNIEKDRRICPTCLTVVEAETHFLFDCPIYEDLRKSLPNPISRGKG